MHGGASLHTAVVSNSYVFCLSFTLQIENDGAFFDTLRVNVSAAGKTAAQIEAAAIAQGANVRRIDANTVGLSFGEAITHADTVKLLTAFGVADAAGAINKVDRVKHVAKSVERESAYLTHPVFNTHHSETQMLRYMKSLENKVSLLSVVNMSEIVLPPLSTSLTSTCLIFFLTSSSFPFSVSSCRICL